MMRFHLVDRLDQYELGTSVLARKVTSASETFWRPDVDGRPEMPPTLILESLCQAGTWLIMLSTERKQRAALLQVERVEFGRPVRPGEVLTISGRVEAMNDQMAVLAGDVDVDDQRVLSATGVMCALLDADQLDDDERSERMLTALAGTGGDAA